MARHLKEPGLGHLIRLYGTATGTRKLTGRQGRDIDGGEAKLDLEFLHEAVREKRAHRFWVLTTYTTLVNYQHSLAKVPFAAAVFDEIQALKNPFSMHAEPPDRKGKLSYWFDRNADREQRLRIYGPSWIRSRRAAWIRWRRSSAAMARRPRKTWRDLPSDRVQAARFCSGACHPQAQIDSSQ